MLMSPNKGETAVHRCHCPGDIAVHMRELVYVCPLLCVCLMLRLTNTVFSAVLIYSRVDPSSGKKKVKPVPSVKEEARARTEKQSETEKEEREGGGGGCLPVIVTSSFRPKYVIAWNKLEYYTTHVQPTLSLEKARERGRFWLALHRLLEYETLRSESLLTAKSFCANDRH